MFDDFVRLPLTIFITRSTNKVWKYKKEYKTIDLYTFHPKKDALPILQECPYSRWWLVPWDEEGKKTCSQVPPIQSQCRVSYTTQHKRSLETAIPPQDLFQAKRAEILNFNLKLKFTQPFQQDNWQRARVEAGGSRSRLGAVLWKICPGFSELPGLQALSLCLVWCMGWAWRRMELRETRVKSLNKPFSTVRADWPVGD